MPAQIAVRLSDAELALLDELVAEGRGANRAEVVRVALARMRRDARNVRDAAVLAAHPYDEFDGLSAHAGSTPVPLD